MTCDACERNGGFEGDPPEGAVYTVSVTAPEDAAAANPPELLCNAHARYACEAYIGFGWGVRADLLDPNAADALVQSIREAVPA